MKKQTTLNIPQQDQREILLYAFRYSLGRESYCVGTLVDTILNNWETLSAWDKANFAREITEHKYMYGKIGSEMDEANWGKIIQRYNDDLEKGDE